jgi:hypothetical protein
MAAQCSAVQCTHPIRHPAQHPLALLPSTTLQLVARKKYEMVSPPDAKPTEMAAIAVDALATVALGGWQGLLCVLGGPPVPCIDMSCLGHAMSTKHIIARP